LKADVIKNIFQRIEQAMNSGLPHHIEWQHAALQER
jgi:hypothetical protein